MRCAKLKPLLSLTDVRLERQTLATQSAIMITISPGMVVLRSWLAHTDTPQLLVMLYPTATPSMVARRVVCGAAAEPIVIIIVRHATHTRLTLFLIMLC